jgi:hypothetical protein
MIQESQRFSDERWLSRHIEQINNLVEARAK